ncbi:LacI family DNA-binding transcriptional regulator [Rhizobium sp. NPDC090275]|uniref:LacI family DNA-binding transcriptional regulator n=1 Tax=Rhizobium sp. NPDC090275 TaxID=3364498 RepID=UPI00383B2BEA
MKKTEDNSSTEGSSALMADVARLAGVAISTVSRALANPGRVNEKTRARIAAAAEELGYTPNAAARNLRVGKSNVIMIILPGSLHYGASQIIPQVLEAVNRTVIRNGYNLMIANLDRDESSERHILDLAFGGTVRGALILSSQLPVVANRSLAEAGLPIVSLLLDMSETSVPSIITNDRQAVKEAARELLALGHRRFFYIAGPTGNYHDVERYAGLVEALQDAGLSEENVTRSGGDLSFQFGFETGLQAAAEFASFPIKPTAVVATSDDMAISFMSKVQKMGWRVPDDLSIVSFDGSPVCEYCAPPLSTIEQPMEALGEAATEFLIARMEKSEDPRDPRVVIPSRFIRRDSIGLNRQADT